MTRELKGRGFTVMGPVISIFSRGVAGAALLTPGMAESVGPAAPVGPMGWGVDACLTAHVNPAERAGYLELLKASGVRVLRERGVSLPADGTPPVEFLANLRQLTEAGFQTVCFVSLPPGVAVQQPGNALAEDLLAVHAGGKLLGRYYTGAVTAFEMVGEPDLGYCTDLPDRVAAYQKALYLGIKAGGKEQLGDGSYELGGRNPNNKEPSTNKAGAREAQCQLDVKREGLGVSDANGKARLSDGSYSLAGTRTNNPQPSTNNSKAPIVLMGALGMPPGPWLERAAANGLLDYTDAYNFHFYGHAEDLTSEIAAHRAAISRLGVRSDELGGPSTSNTEPLTPNERQPSLPLWITEAGIEAVAKDDFLNPQRRHLQADFTISTAKQALAAEEVAVFMPFILVHDKDPYAMMLSPWKTFPAWDSYAKFSRENPWPKRPLARASHNPNPVVVQWLPDNKTTMPHKVAGTYRFRDGQPIKGELRIYNFSDAPVEGRLEAGELKVGRVILNAPQVSDHGGLGISRPTTRPERLIRIPPIGMVSLPLEFVATGKGYFRETWAAAFVELGRVVPNAPNEGPDAGGLGTSRPTFESRVSFGLEAWAKPEDFTDEPLPLRPLPNGVIRFPQIEPYVPGEQVGAWTTMNGLRGEAPRKLGVNSYGLEVSTASNTERLTSNLADVSAATFWIEQPNTDPLAPAMAVAAVDGLPASGFLRLQLDKPMARERKVLVVLVDDRGQRYTIWENFGADYYGSRSDIWLNLEDFHADFWGPMSADYQFRPERIREVHLRLYLSTPNDKVRVELTLLKAK